MNHVGTQTIETDRLILRQYYITDVHDMYKNWVTDPNVSRFWGWKPHKNIEETKTLLSGWIKEYSNLQTYHWVIILRTINEAIGYIYLNEINNDENSVSVHFLLSQKYWNQGIMTEACKSVFDFAFSVMKAERIHTFHHIENVASGQVLKKAGMEYVKTEYRLIPDCDKISGDYCFYEIWHND